MPLVPWCCIIFDIIFELFNNENFILPYTSWKCSDRGAVVMCGVVHAGFCRWTQLYLICV